MGSKKNAAFKKQRVMNLGEKVDYNAGRGKEGLQFSQEKLKQSEEEYTKILKQIDAKYKELEAEKKKLQKHFEITIQGLERQLGKYRENIINLSGTLNLPLSETVLTNKIKSGTKAVKAKTDAKTKVKTKGVRGGDSR